MDFNTQRKIVKKLREKGKNPLLFLPCLIAIFAVAAFMTIGRSIDMALSDKDGNFLGIKRKAKQPRKAMPVPVPSADAVSSVRSAELSSRKKKRIKASLPYRSFGKRAGSLGLAAAFVMMLVPEFTVAAATVGTVVYTAPRQQNIRSTDVPSGAGKTEVYQADLYTSYAGNSPYALQVDDGVFNGFPSLTTVTLGYCVNMRIGNNNFTNIAPDATVYINTPTKAEFDAAAAMITSGSVAKVWNKDNIAYNRIPSDVNSLTAKDGVGKVVLRWYHKGYADGYNIYKYSGGVFSSVGSIPASAPYIDPTMSVCTYEVSNAAQAAVYAVRAYRYATDCDYDNDGTSDVTVPLYSKRFTIADNDAKALTAGTPVLNVSMSNNIATANISMPSAASDPSYIVLYRREGNQTSYSPVQKINAADLTGGSCSYRDPEPYSGDGTRSYVAVAYYDVFGINNNLPASGFVFPDTDESSAEYTTKRSTAATVSEAVLNKPENLNCSLSSDNSAWILTWEPPLESSGLSVEYTVNVNGRPFGARSPSLSVRIPVNSPEITPGEDVTFTVTAHAAGLTSSEPATVTESVKKNCVVLNSAVGGNSKVTVNFKEYAGTTLYTIYFSHTEDDGTERVDYKKVASRDCVKKNGNLEYTIDGLTNDTEYTVWIASDAPTAKYISEKKKVTPSKAPQPPQKVYVRTFEKGAEITWDIVLNDDTKEPVDGYYVTIKKESGQVIVSDSKVEGNTSFTCSTLDNDVNYYAYVSSYIIVNDDPPIPSVNATRSDLFRPTVSVDTVPSVTAKADGKTIKVNWTTVSKATKYYLRRTNGSEILEWDMGSSTSYVDNEVRNNVEYSYTVKAVRIEDSKTYESAYSDPAKAKINVTLPPVTGLSSVGGPGEITLKWDPIKEADGYYIEYFDEASGTWKRLAGVAAGTTTYTDTGLPSGSSRKYRVIPYTLLFNNEPVYDDGTFTDPIPYVGHEGIHMPAPLDFDVVAGDGSASLTWKTVDGADGYHVYVIDAAGNRHLLDSVSKNAAIHKNISNGTTVTYAVCGFKNVNGQPVDGELSIYRTVTIGVLLDAPTDVKTKAGDTNIEVSWKSVKDAEGYVVYCYNISNMSFIPVGIVTDTKFSHTGLTNNREYTYMICAYKKVNGELAYSQYSLAVTDIPKGSDKSGSSGSSQKQDEPSDYRIYITGTTPYGMSNSNLISAFAAKGAFDTDIDVRFTLSPNSVAKIQTMLNYYGTGVDSFLYYPMDITLYEHNTDKRAYVAEGYYMTLTIPVPDELLGYTDSISVVHISDTDKLEILPSIPVDVNGTDCIQFNATSFYTYAFVVYVPYYAEDTSAGTAATENASAETQTTASYTFRCTDLPDIYRRRARNKVYRIVSR